MQVYCAFLAAFVIVTGVTACGPKPSERDLGEGTVTYHKFHRVGFNRRECQFTVEVDGRSLGYVTPRGGDQASYTKCATLKKGYKIKVTEITLLRYGKTETAFVGNADGTMFQLR